MPLKHSIVQTDQDKFMSIFTNLIKNAIKNTEKGSIEFGCNIKDKFLEFYVKDTGIGIDSNRQEAIFERFIQADIEDKMAKQGAGLGLSIIQSIIHAYSGQIYVQSEQGYTSFTMEYPVTEY